jgi:hypothetical protein
MSESKTDNTISENTPSALDLQRRVANSARRIYLLSWVSLVSVLLLIVRFFVIFTFSAKLIAPVAIAVFAVSILCSICVFTLSGNARIFILAGIFLFLASLSDFIAWYSLNSVILVIFWPLGFALTMVYQILLSYGMQYVADELDGRTYDLWKHYRRACVALCVARFLSLYGIFTMNTTGIDIMDSFPFSAIIWIIIFSIVAYCIGIWQFFLLRRTAEKMNEYSKLSVG